MTDRRFAILLIAWMLVTALLLGWSIGKATGAPPPDPSQRLLDQSTAWAADVLGVQTTPRTLVVVDEHDLIAGWGSAQVRCDDPSRIEINAWHGTSWGQMAMDPTLVWDEDAVRLVLHEAVHLGLGTRGCDFDTDGQAALEEGVTEAVMLDLLPAWSRRFLGAVVVGEPEGPYAPLVRGVRAASTLATGSRSYRDRDARLWRRALLLAGTTERVRMMATAEGG